MRIACLLLFTAVFLLQSCGLFGIHLKVHNPKRPAPAPRFSAETVLLGELTPIRSNFDVHFYGLDLNIVSAKKTIDGWVEIGATALKDIDSIQLDMDQPLKLDELRWERRDGKILSSRRKFRAVFIGFPETVRKGEKFTIHVKYHGKPISARKPPWSGGLVWKKDKEKNDHIGVACETEGASIWFPCKDHTSDEADSTHLRFTIPDNALSVVSNGQFVGSERKAGFQSFSWKVTYPINTYNITFYVGNFVKITDKYKGINGKEMELNHYVLKPNEQKARNHFQQAKTHIRIYEELYGEYCWYNDGFKLVESPFEGMEHQSAIAYGNGYWNDLNLKDDYIILHETGHEWFGNAITASDLADVWLHEGITTYGEALYLEKRYGANIAFNHLMDYRIMIKNKRPVVGVFDRRNFDYHDGDAYVKGAWILHSLRNQVKNDTVFFSILKTFYEENKLKLTDSKTFIATVNQVTGKDYQWFFDQYLYQNKVPFLEVSFSEDGYLYYRWTDVKENFNQFTVPVRNTLVRSSFEICPTMKIQRVKLPADYTVPESYVYDGEGLFGIRRNKKLEKLFTGQ